MHIFEPPVKANSLKHLRSKPFEAPVNAALRKFRDDPAGQILRQSREADLSIIPKGGSGENRRAAYNARTHL